MSYLTVTRHAAFHSLKASTDIDVAVACQDLGSTGLAKLASCRGRTWRRGVGNEHRTRHLVLV